MRISWLYLATRSVREALPVLICPAPQATARSAMKVSSVSPERWEMTVPYALPLASSMHWRVSVSVPIWFTLMRMALATPSSIPLASRSTLVTKQVVAHQLHAVAEFLGHGLPAGPVIFGQAVLDGHDGGTGPASRRVRAIMSAAERRDRSLFLNTYMPSS